ncbi:glycosyltransferase [Synechococcus elongatus]|uniref:glycosyltransferase n=1 Tax=Synechococcus elongatus TaxID=32046 RepID=UPI000F7D9C6F|nr:glycosyltransferase [Synechococcus elongatus]
MGSASSRRRIYIGTEANQYLAEQTLIYSIRKHLSDPSIEIIPLTQTQQRVGGTRFGFVRFTLPQAMGYQGKALYLDADQLALTDLAPIFDLLPDDKAIACVYEAEGLYNGKPHVQTWHTSVMLLDCEQLAWQPDELFATVVPNKQEPKPGQIRYRNFMELQWFEQERIAKLPPSWNHFNIVTPETNIVHFSHVRSQPWKNPRHELTDFWLGYLKEAIAAGYLRRRDVVAAVARGHVHPWTLKAIA